MDNQLQKLTTNKMSVGRDCLRERESSFVAAEPVCDYSVALIHPTRLQNNRDTRITAEIGGLI